MTRLCHAIYFALALTVSPARAAGEAAVPEGNRSSPSAVAAPAGSVDELKARLLDLKDLSIGGTLPTLPTTQSIYVEFVGSPLLGSVVSNDLRARGLTIASTPVEAIVKLTLRGRIQLDGSIGRRYFDVGEIFEKIAASDPDARDIVKQSAAFQFGTGLREAALAQGWYRVGLFDKFLRNYFTVVGLSDALGLRGGVNTLIAGDPRGFCLSNCDHWKHVHHTVLLFAKVDAAEQTNGTVTVKAWMTQVDPQPVFDFAYEMLLTRLVGSKPQ